jgi:pimeloyl-ACP methyl ester carboxylesterase
VSPRGDLPGRGGLHRLVDRLAWAVEDRVDRPAVPWRAGAEGPLDPFGEVGPRPPVRITEPSGPRSGTAILLPPWKFRSPAVLSGWVGSLAGAGFEVWLAIPPLHLERTPPGHRSGEGVVTPDLGRMRALLEQSVVEARACVARATALGGEVVVVGLSFGALVAAWLATGPERVGRAALVAPPADLAAVFRETPIGRRYAALAERAGEPIPAGEALTRRLAWLAPLHRRPTAGRVLVAGGRYDAIAVGGAPALARAWDLPLREFPRGHLTLLFGCRSVRREVARFVGDGERS